MEQTTNTVYPFAGILADIAMHIEQEVLKEQESVAFNPTNVTHTTFEQGNENVVFENIELPEVTKNDDRFKITNNVTFAMYFDDDTSSPSKSFIENVTLLVDGNVVAHFTHVSSPEVFSSAVKNYDKFMRQQEQTN